ncbi:hypothetical protein GALMADRAFT_215158 [Galerina marginata CBS 339.88]|uniref:Zinc finger PHD-type domain-containing protein n=1 Tax=Galerina marginata (strain CBS 339.88) TaxID=685588 RepID=A0A067SF36_GALM3|nr:hypothetical protein GALMADRAFT_215158 [Galerina marginata CBS 339.88]
MHEADMRVDVEDTLGAELASSNAETTQATAIEKAFNSKVLIHGQEKSKARALKEFTKYRQHASSTDRLKRVQAVPRFVDTEKLPSTNSTSPSHLDDTEQPINPTTSTTHLRMPFYLLQSTFLVALTASLYQSLTVSDLKNVPKFPQTKEYPYREASDGDTDEELESGLDDEPVGGDLDEELDGDFDKGDDEDFNERYGEYRADMVGIGEEMEGDAFGGEHSVQNLEESDVAPVQEPLSNDSTRDSSNCQGSVDTVEPFQSENGLGLGGLVVEPDEEKESDHEVIDMSRRPKRKRVQRKLALDGCLCGSVLNGSTSGVLRCKHAGCETQWYHLECVELELEPRNWACAACEASVDVSDFSAGTPLSSTGHFSGDNYGDKMEKKPGPDGKMRDVLVPNAGCYNTTIRNLSVEKHWGPIFEEANNVLNASRRKKKGRSRSASSQASSEIVVDDVPNFFLVSDDD